jgi:hypothetical protein
MANPQDVFDVLSYYLLVKIFVIMICLTVAFAFTPDAIQFLLHTRRKRVGHGDPGETLVTYFACRPEALKNELGCLPFILAKFFCILQFTKARDDKSV